MSKPLIVQQKRPLAKITSQALCESYSPDKSMRLYSKCNTAIKAINSNAPTLSSLVRTIGQNKVEAYIKLWLIDLNRTLDLKKPLKEHQIDQIAFAIVDKYRNLNIADINLIFQNAKYGEYGDFYDRITMPTVLKWFRVYFDSRCNAAADQSYQNHIQHKSNFANVSRASENKVKIEMRKATVWHKKKQELKQAQERINKIKSIMSKQSYQ